MPVIDCRQSRVSLAVRMWLRPVEDVRTPQNRDASRPAAHTLSTSTPASLLSLPSHHHSLDTGLAASCRPRPLPPATARARARPTAGSRAARRRRPASRGRRPSSSTSTSGLPVAGRPTRSTACPLAARPAAVTVARRPPTRATIAVGQTGGLAGRRAAAAELAARAAGTMTVAGATATTAEAATAAMTATAGVATATGTTTVDEATTGTAVEAAATVGLRIVTARRRRPLRRRARPGRPSALRRLPRQRPLPQRLLLRPLPHLLVRWVAP
jgi:hypothetical protein